MTPLATCTHSKDLTKLAILPDYRHPLILCIVLWSQKKLGVQQEVRRCQQEGQKPNLQQPTHSKDTTKSDILPDYKHPWMLCLTLRTRQKVLKYDFQSEFSMPKIIRIFPIFVSIKNKSLVANILVTLISKPLYLLKTCPIFDEAAKLFKSSEDSYNLGVCIIL
jgi:hypothetical protein